MIRKRGRRQEGKVAIDKEKVNKEIGRVCGWTRATSELIRKRGRRHGGKIRIDKEKGLKARGEGSSYITKLYYTI